MAAPERGSTKTIDSFQGIAGDRGSPAEERGGEPDPRHVQAVDAYFVSAAEHGMNASTFTARVIASTGADVAAAMRDSDVAWHTKIWSDGFGHVIHNWFAVGRPVFVQTDQAGLFGAHRDFCVNEWAGRQWAAIYAPIVRRCHAAGTCSSARLASLPFWRTLPVRRLESDKSGVLGMADRFDIVVAGAGHNSLVAAAYLAKVGYKCLVLEGRSVLGGNVITEELTLPGFRHDSCGTAHVILQDSPMMIDDELGLARDYGLEYINPEIVCHAPFMDGSWLTQYHDIERTVAQFAKFSKKDADAYRRMIAEYDAIKPLFDASSYTPIGFGKPINDRLNEHPDGKKWLRRQAQSAWEIIKDNFEDDHSRCFMLWMAFQTVTPPEWPMTGRLAYSLVWGRQRWSWCVPKGGSGVLTEKLAKIVEDNGGVALTNKMVKALIVEGGKCVGVECADGSQYPSPIGIFTIQSTFQQIISCTTSTHL